MPSLIFIKNIQQMTENNNKNTPTTNRVDNMLLDMYLRRF